MLRARRACPAAALALLGAWLAAAPAGADAETTASEVPPGAPGNEIDLGPLPATEEVFWGPNRFGYSMALGLTFWKPGRLDEPTSLWDVQGGDSMLAFGLEYRRMFGDWFGVGGSLLLESSLDARTFTGVGLTLGPRVYLWRDWVYLQVELAAGYPPLVGAIGTCGLSFPLTHGFRLRLENQFWFNVLEDDAEFTFAWFPAFGIEAGF